MNQTRIATAPPPFVEVEVGGQQLRCEYEYSPGRPGRNYMPNGDPGYPDEPEEFILQRVQLFVGATPLHPLEWLDITDLIVELTDEECGRVGEAAYQAFDDARLEAEADRPDDPSTDRSDLSDSFAADRAADQWERDRDARADK